MVKRVSLVTFSLFLASTAWGDIWRLRQDADELNRQVSYSYLSYQIKTAASQLAQQVASLATCKANGGRLDAPLYEAQGYETLDGRGGGHGGGRGGGRGGHPGHGGGRGGPGHGGPGHGGGGGHWDPPGHGGGHGDPGRWYPPGRGPRDPGPGRGGPRPYPPYNPQPQPQPIPYPPYNPQPVPYPQPQPQPYPPYNPQPQNCYYEYQRVVSEWTDLERYASEMAQVPQVYSAYQQALQSLNQLRYEMGEQPLPNPQYQAAGTLDAYSFSFQAYSSSEVQTQCQSWAQSLGLNWVNQVVVNNRYVSGGRTIHISEACALVSQNAEYR